MLSFYKIINAKLVFIARVKHEASAQRVIRQWRDGEADSEVLIAFENPTPSNPDGFVAHWTRTSSIITDEQIQKVFDYMSEPDHFIAA